MADKNNKADEVEVIVEAEPVIEQKAQPDEQQPSKKSGKGMSIYLILIIFLAALAGTGGYFGWEYQQQQLKHLKQQDKILYSLNKQINSITEKAAQQKKLINDQQLQINSLLEKTSLTEQISQQAIEIVNRTQRDWVLAETDYLLRIAHQRIEVARDISGAIAALKGADRRIHQLSDLGLFKIRKQIAKDIANLKAIHQADINGISLIIDEMVNYLPELPFKTAKDEIEVQLTENKAVEQPGTDEQTFVDSVLDTVKKIGDIKVHQRSIKAASSAEQQSQIEQLMRTYLFGIRLAALRFDQVQFLSETQKATELLHLHYDTKDNRVQEIEKTLNDYSAMQLRPDLPELTKAWKMLQQAIDEENKPKKEVAEKSVVKPVKKAEKLKKKSKELTQ